MHLISDVIEQLKERYIQPQPPPTEPELPEFVSYEDTLVVIKAGHCYKIEDLKFKRSFVVSKAVDGIVYCSCEKGKEKQKCIHKLAVLKEAQRLRKLKIDECIKRKIASSMSAYIFRIRQIVTGFEIRNDTKNCTYWYWRGRLQTYRHVLRIIIEA